MRRKSKILLISLICLASISYGSQSFSTEKYKKQADSYISSNGIRPQIEGVVFKKHHVYYDGGKLKAVVVDTKGENTRQVDFYDYKDDVKKESVIASIQEIILTDNTQNKSFKEIAGIDKEKVESNGIYFENENFYCWAITDSDNSSIIVQVYPKPNKKANATYIYTIYKNETEIYDLVNNSVKLITGVDTFLPQEYMQTHIRG